MKLRKILSILLIAALVLSCVAFASAATAEEERKASALYELNLFRGVSTTTVDFALDKSLNRAEGIVMLIRMLGVENEALNGKWSHPFTDLTKTNSSWADKYIGYAYEKGFTNGTGKTTFSGGDALTDQQFATMCLRSLGYSDSGTVAEFQWNDSTSFAAKKGILASGAKVAAFDRGNAVIMIWSFVNAKLKNSMTKLADRLISNGVFTSSDFAQATKIANGTASGTSSGSSISGSSSGSSSGADSGSDSGSDSTNGDETSNGIKIPTTWEEFKALTDTQKYRLEQMIGEEEYAKLEETLRTKYHGGATEIGENSLSLDDIFKTSENPVPVDNTFE